MCLFQQKRDEVSQGRWESRAGTNARFERFSVTQVFQDIPQDILNEWGGLSGRRTCTMATIVMWTSRCKLDSLRDKLFSLKKSLYRIQTTHRTSYHDRPINISISETFIHRHFNQSPPHKKSRHWSIGLTTLERVHRKNKQLLVWITVYIPLGSGWWTCTQPNTVLSVSLDPGWHV